MAILPAKKVTKVTISPITSQASPTTATLAASTIRQARRSLNLSRDPASSDRYRPPRTTGGS